MASTAAIGIMREQALKRLNAAAERTLGTCGMEPSTYTGLSKDREIATIRMIEAIAGDLERLAERLTTDNQDDAPAGESPAEHAKRAPARKKA